MLFKTFTVTHLDRKRVVFSTIASLYCPRGNAPLTLSRHSPRHVMASKGLLCMMNFPAITTSHIECVKSNTPFLLFILAPSLPVNRLSAFTHLMQFRFCAQLSIFYNKVIVPVQCIMLFPCHGLTKTIWLHFSIHSEFL